MTATTDATQRLELGRVMQEAVAVIRGNLVLFAAVGVVAVAPQIVSSATQVGSAVPSESFVLRPIYWIGVFISLFATAFVQATLLYAGVRDLEGRRPTIAEALGEGLKLFLPAFALSLLFLLAFVVGLALLFVPGVMIALAWCVAMPALVVERTGITESFRRSAALTKGFRWRILGFFALILLGFAVVNAVLAGLGLAIRPRDEISGLRVLGSAVYSWASTVAMVAITAALFFQLRSLKEGLGGASAAAVFD